MIQTGHGISTTGGGVGGSSPIPVEAEERRFMLTHHERQEAALNEDTTSGLESYIKGFMRAGKYESTIAYWVRQKTDNQQARFMVELARQVLGLPASSTNVERIFSQVGCATSPYRGSLSPETLIAQAGSRILLKQGFSGSS